MLGSEATVRHPTRGEYKGWRTDNLRARSGPNLPPKRHYTFFSGRARSTSPLEAKADPLESPAVGRSGGTRDRVPPGAKTSARGPGRPGAKKPCWRSLETGKSATLGVKR